MEHSVHHISKKRDRTNENFRRAAQNIMWRCDEMSQQYQADVYILLQRRGQYFEYTSIDRPSWPTPAIELESIPPPSPASLLTSNRARPTQYLSGRGQQTLCDGDVWRKRIRTYPRIRTARIQHCQAGRFPVHTCPSEICW
jgi:hypothetical protein